MFGLKNFWIQKISGPKSDPAFFSWGPKNFGCKKILGPKKFVVQETFGLEILVKKCFGFGLKVFLVGKMFGPKKILIKKKIWVSKHFGTKILVPKSLTLSRQPLYNLLRPSSNTAGTNQTPSKHLP